MKSRGLFLSIICGGLLAVLPCGSLLYAQSDSGLVSENKPVITHFAIKHVEELPNDYANVTLVFYGKGGYEFHIAHDCFGTMTLRQYIVASGDSLFVVPEVDRLFDNNFTIITYDRSGNVSRYVEIVLPAKPTASVEKSDAERIFSVKMADHVLQLSNPCHRQGTVVVYDLSGAVMLQRDFNQVTHWFALPAQRHSVVVVCVLEGNKPVFSKKVLIE